MIKNRVSKERMLATVAGKKDENEKDLNFCITPDVCLDLGSFTSERENGKKITEGMLNHWFYPDPGVLKDPDERGTTQADRETPAAVDEYPKEKKGDIPG